MARTAKLEIEVDSRRARDGTSAADRELQRLKRSATSTVNELRELGRSGDVAGNSLRGAGRSASTATNEIRGAGRAADATARDMDRLARETRDVDRSTRDAGISVGGMVDKLNMLRGAMLVVGGLALAKEILDASDAVKKMNAELLLSIPSTTAFATAQADVRRISGEVRNDLGATNELYAKFSRASADMGQSQEGAARATETFAKTLKISGAGADEAANTTRQFGQALASGTLRGDEFNTVMESSPRLARLLAASMGQPIGKLREMAADGQLTADKLYAALTDTKFTAAIDAEFQMMPVTFGEAMTRVKDTATVTFAAFDRGGEFSNMLIEFMLGGTESMDSLEKRAEDFGINVRSIFAGLGEAFAPATDAGNSFFDVLDVRTQSNRDAVAELLGVYDQLANVWIGADRMDKSMGNALKRGGVLNENIWGPQEALPEWSDRAGKFRKGFDEREATLKGKQAERRALENMPRQFQIDPGEIGDYMKGTGRFAPPKAPPAPSTGTEIGRTMSSADLDKALRGIGAVATSGQRTAAEQRGLIQKWERENPRTRGIRPADPDKSDHVVGNGLARDIRKTPGMTLDKITAAVGGKGNIKQLLDEGDHFHLALKGKGGGAGGKSDAEREAERLERMRKKRAEDEADFWRQLQDQGKAAAMLPREAEQFNAELKLTKILQDGNIAGEVELSKAQKQRIADAIATKNMAEFEGSAKKSLLDAEREGARLADVADTIAKSTLETEADNLAVQERLWPLKLDAMTRGLDLQDATVKKVLAEAEARARGNIELERRNRLVQEGVAVAAEYATPQMQQASDRKALEDKKVAAGEAVWAGKLTKEVYESTIKGLDQAIYEVDHRFEYEFIDSIDRLAGHFTGKFGDAIGGVAKFLNSVAAMSKGDFTQSGPIGAIIDVVSRTKFGAGIRESAQGSAQRMMGQLFDPKTIANPIRSLSSGMKDFKGDLRNVFGKGGDFAKGAGAILGKAAMGASIGSATNSILGAVGVKLNKTGSSLGGAAGGAVFGPLGAIGGSIIGGLIGNLLTKPKFGGASITSAGVGGTVGSSKAMQAAGTAAGKGVFSALNSLVEELGGTGLNGFGTITVGQYKDKWRVNDHGTNIGGKKNRDVREFESAEEAQAFAIYAAVSRGAVKGISSTMQTLLNQSGEDLQSGVKDALKFKAVQDAYRQMTDPVNFGLEQLNGNFQEVVDMMRRAGASAVEFANAEKVYQQQRQDIIEQGNASSIKEMRQYLFELRGGSSSVFSPELRYSTSRAELDALDKKRAAGGKVEFGDYRSIADSFLSASRDSQGSSLGYFADLKRVTDTLDSWIGQTGTTGITTPKIDIVPVVTAVNDQTNAVTSLLSEISYKLGQGSNVGVAPGSTNGGFQVELGAARYFNLN